MEIAVGFRLLGLQRGSQEADVRKAYRQLALQYHPDRNPAGADMFKRLNEAYELLQKHYKTYGGQDFVAVDIPKASSRGSGAAAPSAPLFTDEELFAGNVGGFASGAGFRASRRHGSNAASGPATPPAETDDTQHQSAQRRREAAHGPRQPVSGYDPFGGDPDALRAFESQRKHFEDMERRKSSLFGNNAATTSQPSAPQSAKESKAASSTVRGETSSSPKGAGGTDNTSSSPSSSSNIAPAPPSRAYSSAPDFSKVPRSAKEMEDEWRAQREAMQRELESETCIQQAERSARRRAVDEETKREWEQTMRAMEEEVRRTSAAAAAAAAHVRVEEDHRANEELRRVADERRKLRQSEYMRRMPIQAELERMNEVELFLMRNALEDAMARCTSLLAGKQVAGTMCVLCGVSKKDMKTRRFTCQHSSTCGACGRSASHCPLCEAPGIFD